MSSFFVIIQNLITSVPPSGTYHCDKYWEMPTFIILLKSAVCKVPPNAADLKPPWKFLNSICTLFILCDYLRPLFCEGNAGPYGSWFFWVVCRHSWSFRNFNQQHIARLDIQTMLWGFQNMTIVMNSKIETLFVFLASVLQHGPLDLGPEPKSWTLGV